MRGYVTDPAADACVRLVDDLPEPGPGELVPGASGGRQISVPEVGVPEVSVPGTVGGPIIRAALC